MITEKKIKPSTRRGTGEEKDINDLLFFRLTPRAFPYYVVIGVVQTRNKRNDSCVALSLGADFQPSCPDGAAGQQHRVAMAPTSQTPQPGHCWHPMRWRSWNRNGLELSTPGSSSQTKD